VPCPTWRKIMCKRYKRQDVAIVEEKFSTFGSEHRNMLSKESQMLDIQISTDNNNNNNNNKNECHSNIIVDKLQGCRCCVFGRPTRQQADIALHVRLPVWQVLLPSTTVEYTRYIYVCSSMTRPNGVVKRFYKRKDGSTDVKHLVVNA